MLHTSTGLCLCFQLLDSSPDPYLLSPFEAIALLKLVYCLVVIVVVVVVIVVVVLVVVVKVKAKAKVKAE